MAILQLNDLSGSASALPRSRQATRSALNVPVLINSGTAQQAAQPVTVGLPFPRGTCPDPAGLSLLDPQGRLVPLQALPLALWSDGSIQWLLLDFLVPSLTPGLTTWTLRERPAEAKDGLGGETLRIVETHQTIIVDTGAAEFQISRTTLQPFTRVLSQGQDILAPSLSAVLLTDAKGLSLIHISGPRDGLLSRMPSSA